MIINNEKYEIIKDVNEGFNKEEVEKCITDYYYDFDYIVGDWAYGKLRLKGFFRSENKNKKNFNDIKNVDTYILERCAYGCKHFILKKTKTLEKKFFLNK